MPKYHRCMRIALVVTIAFLLVQTGCAIGDSQQVHRTNLITRDSLAGIHLGDSRTAVESIFGNGHALKHEAQAFRYHAGLTVSYRTDPDGKPQVGYVFTNSPRFHTASGVRVGSALAVVEALGHMNCGPTSTTDSQAHCQTVQTVAYEPGLSFDLLHGRVTRIWLVELTN
jgi:hypothetical protein